MRAKAVVRGASLAAVELAQLRSNQDDKKEAERALAEAIERIEVAAERRYERQLESADRELNAEETVDLYGKIATVVSGSVGFLISRIGGSRGGGLFGAIFDALTTGLVVTLVSSSVGRGIGGLAAKSERAASKEAEADADRADLARVTAEKARDDANDRIQRVRDQQKLMHQFQGEMREHQRKMRKWN